MYRNLLIFFLAVLLGTSAAYAQGVVKGRVIFEGTPPAIETIEVKSDVSICGQSKKVQKIQVGEGQGIAQAVVTLIGAAGSLQPGEGTLDQVQCEFQPHVQVLPAGSTLKITSSDTVLHNAHAFYEDGSTAFNIAVPIPGMEVSHKLARPGVIKLRCDAGHTWMSGYVVAAESPFYALTDANGNFKLEGVPPGDYQIEIWQEWLGKHREPITVKEGKQAVSLSLKGLAEPK